MKVIQAFKINQSTAGTSSECDNCDYKPLILNQIFIGLKTLYICDGCLEKLKDIEVI